MQARSSSLDKNYVKLSSLNRTRNFPDRQLDGATAECARRLLASATLAGLHVNKMDR